jgi:hypothetical protein
LVELCNAPKTSSAGMDHGEDTDGISIGMQTVYRFERIAVSRGD